MRPLTGRADPSRGTAVRAYTHSLAAALGIRLPATGLVDERAWAHAWDIAGAAPHARPSLLAGLAAHATRLPRTRKITFPGLRYDDARWLAWYLHGNLDADDPVPGLRFVPGDIPFAPGVLSGAGRGRRLARRKQIDLDITFTSDPGELEALHSEIEKVRLANRHGAAFTDEAYAACWQAVCVRLACRGRLEAGTLRLDGQLAAYILAIPGQRAYRVAAGHHDPALDQYRPGRLLEIKTVLQARDRGFPSVDWTSPVAPESLVAANCAQPRWSVTMGIAG
jgi:Acetyltransferase (GNAT) domain